MLALDLFYFGLVLGALLPSFGVYLVYKRNKKLKKQLFALLNPEEKSQQNL